MPWKNELKEAQRGALVSALLEGAHSVVALCRRFKVSRQTGYKFRRRFYAEGAGGLKDRSRRPRAKPSAAARRWRQRLLRWRRCRPSWGARKLRGLLIDRYGCRKVPSLRTLERWIWAAGLVKKRPAKRRQVVLATRTATLADRPNRVWTIDFKGWFCTRSGRKIEPLTIRDQHSRYVLWARPLRSRGEADVRRVCTRLFRRHGVPAVIRCDLGAPFFGHGPHGYTKLSLWWHRLGIRVEFVQRPAINNNSHEQTHRILKAGVRIADSERAQLRALDRWRWQYNHERGHESLEDRKPAELYRSQPGPLPVLSRPTYPASWRVRVVNGGGGIVLPGWRGTVGRAFAGLPIGVHCSQSGHYQLHFGELLLGEINLALGRKLLLAPLPKPRREGA